MDSISKELNNTLKIEAQRKPRADEYISSDGLIYCSKCHTPKQFADEILGLCPIMCRCEKQRKEEKQKQAAENSRLKTAKRLRAEAFCDAESKNCTFSADDGKDPAAIKTAKLYVENWAEMKKHARGLLLLGSVDTGKTFLTCCIANALIDNGVSVYVSTVRQLLNNYSNYKLREALLLKIRDCSLFIIDDLGTELNNEKNNDMLFDIIDTRYRSGKPLIVTTNLSPYDLKNPELGRERLYSRIIEKCTPITINGVHRRNQLGEENAKRTMELLGLR